MTKKYTLQSFIKDVMFYHVVFSWMVNTDNQYKFYQEENDDKWCKVGPWFNLSIFLNLRGSLFEYYFVTTRQDRYDLMCGLYVYAKTIDRNKVASYLNGGRTLPKDSKVAPLTQLH